jgi:hypothetical protein
VKLRGFARVGAGSARAGAGFARAGAGFALAATLIVTATASADSFTPIRLTSHVTPVARAHAPLKMTVAVSADPGVLDVAEGNLQVEVKLTSGECGGDFQTTAGVTLVNAPLTPVPRTGQAYTGTASGAGRPTAFGAQTLCVFLEDADVGRVFANDESRQVNVSRPCTTTAARYDAAEKALTRAQLQLRRTKKSARRRRADLKHTVARHARTATRDRRLARTACGAGVRL